MRRPCATLHNTQFVQIEATLRYWCTCTHVCLCVHVTVCCWVSKRGCWKLCWVCCEASVNVFRNCFDVIYSAVGLRRELRGCCEFPMRLLSVGAVSDASMIAELKKILKTLRSRSGLKSWTAFLSSNRAVQNATKLLTVEHLTYQHRNSCVSSRITWGALRGALFFIGFL